MLTDVRRFLMIWSIAGLAILLLIGVINATVDPYQLLGSPRLPGFNARKIAMSRERVTKAVNLPRARANTLVLGTSTAVIGVDPQSDAWPMDARPVYNSAMGGGGPYTSYRYLQHAVAYRSPRTIVLALDYSFFLNLPQAERPRDPAFEARLAVSANGKPNSAASRERLHDLVHSVLSLEALYDSLSTVAANQRPNTSELTPSGGMHIGIESIFASGRPIFAIDNIVFLRYYANRQRDVRVMADVQAIIELCNARSIRAVVLINPAHADLLEIIDILGYWQDYENWKRELTALVAKYRDSNAAVSLWDFSEYSVYSLEAFGNKGEPLRWFYDSAHYTPRLGDQMIQRALASKAGDFGVPLTPDMIESHLTSIREQRERYLATHPAEIQHLYRLRDELVPRRRTTLPLEAKKDDSAEKRGRFGT